MGELICGRYWLVSLRCCCSWPGLRLHRLRCGRCGSALRERPARLAPTVRLVGSAPQEPPGLTATSDWTGQLAQPVTPVRLVLLEQGIPAPLEQRELLALALEGRVRLEPRALPGQLARLETVRRAPLAQPERPGLLEQQGRPERREPPVRLATSVLLALSVPQELRARQEPPELRAPRAPRVTRGRLEPLVRLARPGTQARPGPPGQRGLAELRVRQAPRAQLAQRGRPVQPGRRVEPEPLGPRGRRRSRWSFR